MKQIKKKLFAKLLSAFTIIFIFLSADLSFAQDEIGLILGPPSNEIKTMAINSSDVLFAGTWGEGVLRSVDGSTWAKSNSGLTNLYISNLSVSTGGEIYAATYGGGAFKSTDNGANWVSINNGIDNLSLKAIFPFNDNIIFAGSNGSGIYRSTNAGTTWTKVNKGLTYRDINCFGSSITGAIYAGTYGGGLFRSLDSGKTWLGKSGIPNNYINQITRFKDGKSVVCTNGRGLYLSDNDGKSWSEFADPQFSLLGDQNVTCFTDIKTNNNTYVVGTRHRGIYNYKTVTNDYFELGGFRSGVNAMVQTSQKVLYIASAMNGVYKSADQGLSWTFVISLNTNTYPFKFNLWSDASTNLLFAGRNDGGLYTSTDFGNTWTADNFPGKICSDVIVAANGNPIAKFQTTVAEGMFRSSNNGISWNAFGGADSIRNFGRAANGDLFASYVRITGSPPSVTTYTRLKKSTDNGNNWIDLTFQQTPYAKSWICGLPNGDIFVGSDNNPPRFSRSVNGGTSFTTTTFSSTVGVRDFEMTPNGAIWMITDNGIYKSTNGGTVWPQINMNFAAPKTNPTPVGFCAASRNDNEVYLGLDGDGIYRTFNGGTSFDSLNYAFNVSDVQSAVRNKDGDIFLSTNSLYRSINPASMGIVGLVSPDDMTYAMDLSPSTTWTNAAKADMYELQITRYDDFNFVQYRYVLKDTNVTIFDTLQNNTTYYWRVRGKNFGSYSNWSNVRSFTTKLVPPVQTLPKDSACGVKISSTLSWKPVDGADNYTYEISTSKSFTTIAATGSVANPMDTFAITAKLNPLTNYYWRVKASNTLTNASDWSAVKMFKTAVDFPKQKFPANNSLKQDINITFLWDTVAEATKYNIQIAKDSLMEQILYSGAASDFYTHEFKDFAYNSKVWWRLQAGNDCGLGEWSSSWVFNTSLQAPKKAYPDTNKINTEINPLFRWAAVKGANSYRLQVSEDANFATFVIDSSGITSTEVNIKKQLKDFTNYYWRTSTKLGTEVSDFNEAWKFRTWVDTVALETPIDKAENQAEQLILRWSKPAGADTFHLQIATDFNFNNLFVDTNKLTFNQTDFKFKPGTTYYWRVQGKEKAAAYRPWSPVWTFKIAGNSVAMDELKQSIKVMPNPIGNKLSIEFTLPTVAKIDVRILDISGRELVTILSEKQMEGTQRLDWNAEQLAAGTYYIQFLVDGEIFVKEIQKLK